MADNKIDMSLDDIIKMSKNQRSSGGPDRSDKKRPRRSNPYPQKNFRKQNDNRRSDTFKRSPEPDVWRHDMFQDEQRAQPQRKTAQFKSSNGSTTLRITNLHYNVSEEDIKELFSDFGVILKSTLFYDKSGRSMGVAEIVYATRQEALSAQRKYNNVPLDEQPMEIVLKEDAKPKSDVSSRIDMSSRLGSRAPQTFERKEGGRPEARRGRQFQGRARGQQAGRAADGAGREKKQDVTREQLDADLDDYLSKGTEPEPMME